MAELRDIQLINMVGNNGNWAITMKSGAHN